MPNAPAPMVYCDGAAVRPMLRRLRQAPSLPDALAACLDIWRRGQLAACFHLWTLGLLALPVG